MASTTGIELGPESCVLVGIRPRRGSADLFAVGRIGPESWPVHDVALATALREMRRNDGLPRRARVVAWGLPQSTAPGDPVTRAALRPLLSAGFRIEAVMHPADALAALAAGRPRAGDGVAVAWMALNTHGAAIAIVRGAEVLFSRTFDWHYDHAPLTPKAQLLQRYSLISHLAPELRRGIQIVQTEHGLRVDTAVTCGDLPDLRSLTMPLIEELDLEVETLDSADALRPIGRAKGEPLAESAPALRLACAAVLGPSRSGPKPAAGLLRAAAAVAFVGGLGWLGSTYWSSPRVERAISRVPSANGAQASAPSPDSSVRPTRPVLPPRTSPPSQIEAAAPGERLPVEGAPPPAASAAPPAPSPVAPFLRRKAAPAQPQPGPVANLALAPIDPAPAQPRPAEPEPAQAAAAPPSRARKLVPLGEPLPRIDSILIDRDRRLAVVNGGIVGIGDAVGPRVVLEIDRDGVVFREPSGFEVRVPLRGQKRRVSAVSS